MKDKAKQYLTNVKNYRKYSKEQKTGRSNYLYENMSAFLGCRSSVRFFYE